MKGIFLTLDRRQIGSAGAAQFYINLPAVPDPAVFDVEFRLVGSLSTPTVERHSECFTVHVK